jgi:hypothetical protein
MDKEITALTNALAAPLRQIRRFSAIAGQNGTKSWRGEGQVTKSDHLAGDLLALSSAKNSKACADFAR